VSSQALAAAAGVNSAKVRKDLSHLGSYGTRGVGYEVDYLVYQISRELGLTQHWSVVLVGVGNLGHALAGYDGFGSRGFRIEALFGRRPPAGRRGRRAASTVRPSTSSSGSCARAAWPSASSPRPAEPAQAVCDRLVAAGVTSILNFAPDGAAVPAGRRPAQGRPRARAADPVLPRAPQGRARRRQRWRCPA
jgi:redox-sensing transcriptional repressor